MKPWNASLVDYRPAAFGVHTQMYRSIYLESTYFFFFISESKEKERERKKEPKLLLDTEMIRYDYDDCV